jgi:hypothetical protein
VPERSFAGRRRGPIASINVWLAAALLRPRTAAASVMAAITAALLINLLMLVLMKPAETLFLDCTEAYAWGRQFLFGYGRHPPVTGWIAGVWYRVFPAENWASYALSQVMTGISLVSIYFIGKHVLGRRRATLVVFAMLLYPLFVGGKSDHYNNAQVLLAILPLTVWMFLRLQKANAVARIDARFGRGGLDANVLFGDIRIARPDARRCDASRQTKLFYKPGSLRRHRGVRVGPDPARGVARK